MWLIRVKKEQEEGSFSYLQMKVSYPKIVHSLPQVETVVEMITIAQDRVELFSSIHRI